MLIMKMKISLVKFFRYRHYTPESVPGDGYEPINVQADGNCLYQSALVHLYGTEKNWCLIKLAALKYGLSSENIILQEVCIVLFSFLFYKKIVILS